MINYIILIIILLFFDFVTKLFFKGKHILLFKYLSVNYVENTGALFGIFKDNNLLFIILTLILILVIFYFFSKYDDMRFGLSLISAGAMGNLIDRISYGYVVDFIDLMIWPVFNLADLFITLGVMLLIYKEINGIYIEKLF